MRQPKLTLKTYNPDYCHTIIVNTTYKKVYEKGAYIFLQSAKNVHLQHK